MLKHDSGHALIAGVGFPLARPNRHLFVAANRRRGFRVPVGTLHQADAKAGPPLFSPLEKICKITLSVLEVGLHGNAHVRPISHALFEQQSLEELHGQVTVLVGFHVDVDERPRPPCVLQQWT